MAGRKDKVSAPGTGQRANMQVEAPQVRVQEVVAEEISETRELNTFLEHQQNMPNIITKLLSKFSSTIA